MGGNFDINTPKVRPGNYINIKAKKSYAPTNSTRGICVIPLVGYDWGPNGEFIRLNSDSPDAEIVKLGRSIYDDNEKIMLARLALLKASTVILYLISGGVKATKTVDNLVATAKYAGTRGNDIKVSSVANAEEGFNVSIYLGNELMELYEGVKKVNQLVGSNYVDFHDAAEDSDITAFAGINLEGGTTTPATNSDFAAFLDKIEKIKCNTVLIPVTESSNVSAAMSKVKYLRTKVGKTVQFVFANQGGGDDIGIINLTNSFVYDEKNLTIQQAAAFAAGASAGADKTTSNTHLVVPNATGVIGELSNEESIEAIQKGEMFFSSDDEGNVIIEYDINSLVHPSNTQDDSYKKNRVIRVFDSFADDLKNMFPPNKFDNDEDGWGIMEGLGKALLQTYADDGAIKNVDYDADFTVDRVRSRGDSTYFNVAIQPVDSAEKLYFSISTQ